MLWLLWWRREREEETNRTLSKLIPSAVSLRIAETEQLYQAKRMIGGIGNVLLSTYSRTESGYDPRVSLVDLWGQVMTLRGQILVSRTDDDPLPPVCGFKSSPCVPAPRAHVETHVRVVCRRTRGRFERTHGDVFEPTHGFFHIFSACRITHTHEHTHTHTHTHQTRHDHQQHHDHNDTHHTTPQHTTPHGDRDRERDRERRQKKKTREDETEKMREERQDTTREEKMKEGEREREREREKKIERENGEIEMKEKMIFVRRNVSEPSNPSEE